MDKGKEKEDKTDEKETKGKEEGDREEQEVTVKGGHRVGEAERYKVRLERKKTGRQNMWGGEAVRQ